MGNEFKVKDISVSFADFGTPNTFDDEAFPDAWKSVTITQQDLLEEELRQKHPDLRDAYQKYLNLLQKYNFWEKITK